MDRFEVTKENNFVRIFRLPQEMPEDFCFDGGHEVTFQLIDWFNPIYMMLPIILEGSLLERCREGLRCFVRSKSYFNSDFVFLAITSYGDAFLI